MQFFRILFALILFGLAAAPPVSAADSSEEIPPRLPVEAFARMPMFQGLTLSPDGKYLAYIVPIEGRRNVIIELAGAGDAKPGRMPPIKKFDIDWIRWANDTRLLIGFSAMAQGFGYKRTETRLLAINADFTEYTNIIKKRLRVGATTERIQGQIQTRIIDILPDDPDHILMGLDPERDSMSAVLKVNIYDRKQTTVKRGKSGVQHWLADQQGIPRLGYGFVRTKRVMRYRDPVRKKWLSLHKTDWYDAGFSPEAFMEDPRFAYAIGPIDGRESLVKLNVPEGTIDELIHAHDTVDLGGLVFDHSGRKVIGVRYTDHFSRVHYFDAEMKRVQNAIDQLLPDTANRITQALPGGKVFVILVRNGHSPPEYHVLDLETKQLYYLAARYPHLKPEQMARVEAVTYEARDGLEIPAYVTYPRGRLRENLPTIILPHGGPHSRDTMDFDYLAQFLANRGYLVLQPNFRGSTGYGTAFEKAGRRQWGGVMQDDVTDGTKWLISEGLADPDRICIVGWSYGGYAALMGAVKTPDLFQCAASINGVADLPGLVYFDRKFIGGSYWTKFITLDEEGRRAASPYHRADEIKIPVFLAAAKDDVRVPYKQSKSFYAKIKRQVPATYIQLKTGGHGLDHEDGRQKMLEGLDDFLAEHLPTSP